MKKILVVDDEPVVLIRIKKILEEKYQVALIKNGMEAINYIRDISCPDLLIIDIKMPVMNGMDTVKKLRDGGFKNPVLFLTSVEDGDIKEQCLWFAPADYIVKPGQPEDIIETVGKLL